MLPVGPFIIPSADDSTPRGHHITNMKLDMIDMLDSKFSHKATPAKRTMANRTSSIKNFFARGFERINNRLRISTKSPKAGKGKSKELFVPIEVIAESVAEDASQEIEGSSGQQTHPVLNEDTDNNNNDDDNMGDYMAQAALVNIHEEPTKIFYPQRNAASRSSIKRKPVSTPKQTIAEAASEPAQENEATEAVGAATDSNSPTANNGEEQIGDEAESSPCVSDDSNIDDASDDERDGLIDMDEELEIHEVNPIQIRRDSMMSMDRMFDERADSDESLDQDDNETPRHSPRGEEIELMFDMDVENFNTPTCESVFQGQDEDEGDDAEPCIPHGSLTRTKPVNLQLYHEIQESIQAGQYKYNCKQKLSARSSDVGDRTSWDSLKSTGTQDSRSGSADDTDLTVPSTEEDFDKEQDRNSVDSDEDMSEVEFILGNISSTLSCTTGSFLKLSSTLEKKVATPASDSDDEYEGPEEDEIDEHQQSRETDLPASGRPKRVPDFAASLCIIAEEEDEDDEDFEAYQIRVTIDPAFGHGEPMQIDSIVSNEADKNEHGPEDSDDCEEDEEDEEEFQYFQGWGANKSRYGQFLDDEAEEGRAQMRENVRTIEEWRLSKCSWWLLSVPDVMGNCGGPALMVTTPEGEVKYPQDVTYYSDDEDEE